MTRIERAAAYRGLASAPQASQPATALQIPLAPYARAPAAKADTATQSYPAHNVLAGSIRRWRPTEVDGPGNVNRYNPRNAFAGIGKVCGTLNVPIVRNGDQLAALSSITVTPDRTLLLVAGIKDGFYNRLMTAKMDASGALSDAKVTDDYISWEPPMMTSNGVVVAHCGNLMTGRLNNGAFDVRRTELQFGKPTLVRGDLVLAANNWDLTLNTLSSEGSWTTVASAPLPSRSSGVDSVIVQGDLVIATNARELCTFTLDGEKLTARHHAPITDVDERLCAPVLVGNVVLTTNDGTLRAQVIGADATIEPGASLQCGDGITPVAAFGVFAVVAAGRTLQAIPVRPDGTFGPAQRFEAEGAIVGRPVITSDGVVLVGADDGNVYAVTLHLDGTLAERTRTQVGEPITAGLTMTRDGFVLVPTLTKVVALKS